MVRIEREIRAFLALTLVTGSLKACNLFDNRRVQPTPSASQPSEETVAPTVSPSNTPELLALSASWEIIKPESLRQLKTLTFSNKMSNFAIALNEEKLESLGQEYRLRLEQFPGPENLTVVLYPQEALNEQGDRGGLRFDESLTLFSIQIAGGAIVAEASDPTNPSSKEDRRVMSEELSFLILAGLAGVGELRGYYPEGFTEGITEHYQQSLKLEEAEPFALMVYRGEVTPLLPTPPPLTPDLQGN